MKLFNSVDMCIFYKLLLINTWCCGLFISLDIFLQKMHVAGYRGERIFHTSKINLVFYTKGYKHCIESTI